MFLKPFRVKTQTAVKGSDRKKLRTDVQEQYPSLTSAQVADLIPGKGDMSQAKIVTHSDENFLVYCYQKNPIFFESFKKLFPSVYTLWKFPDMLPGFTTYPPVFEKLLKGADLMLPGVEVRGEHHPRMFGTLQKGDLCLVRLKGNRAPVVLGEALLSGEDMYMCAMKGKGVHTLHMLGDHLWEMGDQSKPPLIPDDQDDDDGDVDTDNKAEEDVSSGGADESSQAAEAASQSMEQLSMQDKGEENSPVTADSVGEGGDGDSGEEETATEGATCVSDILQPDDMDNLLQFCFKCAIKSRVSKSDLPLLTSNFLKGYMQPFVGRRLLDLKKSSYKKFSKFLQQMESEGFIKVQTVSKGVDAIIEVDKSHLELRDLEVPEVVEEVQANAIDSVEEKFEPPQITEVLCVTANVLPLLSAYGYTKGQTLSFQEVRRIVTDYVKNNELPTSADKEQVLLDPILAELALTKSEGDRSYLTWNTLHQRIASKLQPGTLIEFAGKPPLLRKGKMEPIRLDVEQRGSKKKVTTVQNLETFGIDPRHFGQMVQRRVAGSATVVQSEQKNRGLDMQVQGNQVDFIAKFLIETYKIPRKYIQGMENAPKPKRR